MTKFKGFRTGFNRTGSNDTAPNAMGAPKTKYCGRGSVPDGDMSGGYPAAVADTSGSNRRVAKAAHGEGNGPSTRFTTQTAFGSGKSRKGK